jgi:transposase-like protein
MGESCIVGWSNITNASHVWQPRWKAEYDVLAYMSFPKSHWPQIHSTNPIERLDLEVKRRINVVQSLSQRGASPLSVHYWASDAAT